MRVKESQAVRVWAFIAGLTVWLTFNTRESGDALLSLSLPCGWRSPHVSAVALRAPPVHRRPRTSPHATIADRTTSLSEPPGPWALPFLGAPRVLWALIRQRLPELLRDFRAEYGPLFAFRAGPSSQVWVSDPSVLRRVYELPECSGRPVSFEDPFGNFLFLTREPEKAAPIRERQKAWLEAELRPELVREVTAEALEELWPALDAEGPQPWPTVAWKAAMYSAVTRAFLGKEGLLSGAELEKFMTSTKEYSDMRVKGKFGTRGDLGLPPGAFEIREVLSTALERAGRGDAEVALPLIVAATIGGAELFPTLLHWIVLSLAREPKRQEAAAAAADAGDSAALMEQIYAVLRRTAYSVALGPPRKILADSVVDGFRLREGSLLFAMHPAIADEALEREPPDDEDFAKYAFGVGPRACLGQPLAEALLPAALGELLRRYRVELGVPGAPAPRGELRGQLIHPVEPPPLRWLRRLGT